MNWRTMTFCMATAGMAFGALPATARVTAQAWGVGVFGVERDDTAGRQERVEHAKELLGVFYKKIGFTLERADIDSFVRTVMRERLRVKRGGQTRGAPRAIADQVSETVLSESAKFGFDPLFVLAVIASESAFSTAAAGPVGEIGLMQLRPATGKWLARKMDLPWRGKKSLLDPVMNVRLGVAFLASLREQFNSDGRLYLAAYNMGAASVRNAVKRHVRPREYAARVMKRYLKLHTLLKEELGLTEVAQVALARPRATP